MLKKNVDAKKIKCCVDDCAKEWKSSTDHSTILTHLSNFHDIRVEEPKNDKNEEQESVEADRTKKLSQQENNKRTGLICIIQQLLIISAKS